MRITINGNFVDLDDPDDPGAIVTDVVILRRTVIHGDDGWLMDSIIAEPEPHGDGTSATGWDGGVPVAPEVNEGRKSPLTGRCKLGGHDVTLDGGMWRHGNSKDSFECAALRLAEIRWERG